MNDLAKNWIAVRSERNHKPPIIIDGSILYFNINEQPNKGDLVCFEYSDHKIPTVGELVERDEKNTTLKMFLGEDEFIEDYENAEIPGNILKVAYVSNDIKSAEV